MFLPVWAIILLGVGWLGFLWLLIRRDGGGDLSRPPGPVTAWISRPLLSRTISLAPGAAWMSSVAVPAMRFAAKSALRSSATWVTRATSGRA